MRFIVLDTETTGLNFDDGHKIIEIGCVEIVNRKITENNYHTYINPNREIDNKAFDIHGLSNDFLKNKPTFADIVNEFLKYLSNSPLIIHNAPFDVGFLKKELTDIGHNPEIIEQKREVIDTLKMARDISPGKRNTLDALCERYEIDNTSRKLHGALLDAQLLADVYLKMTMGQTDIVGLTEKSQKLNTENINSIDRKIKKVIYANHDEIDLHKKYFQKNK